MVTMILAAVGTALMYFPTRALIIGSDRVFSCFMGILAGFILLLSVV